MANALDILGNILGAASQPTLTTGSPTNIIGMYGFGMGGKKKHPGVKTMEGDETGLMNAGPEEQEKKSFWQSPGGGILGTLLTTLGTAGLGAGLGALSGGKRGAGQGAAMGGGLAFLSDLMQRKAASQIPTNEAELGQKQQELAYKQQLMETQGEPTSVKEYKYGLQYPGFAEAQKKQLALKDGITPAQAFNQEMRTYEYERKLKADEEKDQERDDKAIERLSGKVSGLQDVGNALKVVEKQIGFSLEDFDEKTGKVIEKKGGKTISRGVDLPGVNIPLVGRTSFYSKEARGLDTAITRVFNIEVKDRSGTAVTNSEMERMQQEFASGKFNTEAEKITALKDYKKLLQKEIINRESAFDPKILKKYGERGAFGSGDVYAKPIASPGPAAAPQQGGGWSNADEEKLKKLNADILKATGR